MLAHHAVLRADVFSYTAAGEPWHTQEWLAEIVMALAWAGGWAGDASAVRGARRADGRHRRLGSCAGGWTFLPALLAMVLGLACVTGSLLARPHMLALPLLAIWTAGLVAAREEARRAAPGG